MGRRISFTPEAEAGIKALSGYLKENFGVGKAKEWRKSLLSFAENLLSYPESGRKLHSSGSFEIRKLVFRKRTLIFYRISGEEIIILHVQDARSTAPPSIRS